MFYDYDLKGAYTTGLVDMYPLDYSESALCKDPAELCGHVMGLANVTFQFKPGTRFPCLPVRTELYGLLFPLSGVSYCTAPEIELALKLGAEVQINHAVTLPWRYDKPRVFEQFVRWVRIEREKHDDGSLENSLIKEIGNSCFGKTAQGVKNDSHTNFDPRTGVGRVVSDSLITNPYMAAHVTGFVRAVLGEILASVPAHRTVVSATTDGFLTDAKISELDLEGPLCSRYQALCDLLAGKHDPMLVCKHRAHQLIAMKTRGQLTPVPLTEAEEPKRDKRYVLAKTGVKPPRKRVGKPLNKPEQNEYMLDLYINRIPKQKHDMNHLISMREQWLTESDMVEIKKSIRLNLEFDFKRKPVDAALKPVLGGTHISFDTEPWNTVVDMEEARSLFDGWRKGSIDDDVPDGNCLKTMDDWESWQDFYQSHQATKGKKGINVTREGSAGVLRRVFLRAFAKGKWGLADKQVTYVEVARWLTDNGYPTTEDDVKNSQRTVLVGSVVPVRKPALQLLKLILGRFPSFEYAQAFDGSLEDPDLAA